MDLEVLLKNTSRSLYLSIKALPKSMRGTFAIAYLLCRYADTIADTAVLPAEKRLYWIKLFPQIIEENLVEQAAILAKEITGGTENPYEKILIGRLADCLKIFNQLPSNHKPLVLEVVQAVCEGMKMDLEYFPTENSQEPISLKTTKDLEHYCRLMGGMPGLFWSKLIYLTTPINVNEHDFYERGMHIGDALQIVNILRDLPKDIHQGRCYFPKEDLEKNGLSAKQLLEANSSKNFEPIKKKWINWGLGRIESGKDYFSKLPKMQFGQRAGVAWPILWTVDTFNKLATTPDLLNVTKRVKISRNRVYLTMLSTPLLWISNSLFSFWLNSKIKKVKSFINK